MKATSKHKQTTFLGSFSPVRCVYSAERHTACYTYKEKETFVVFVEHEKVKDVVEIQEILCKDPDEMQDVIATLTGICIAAERLHVGELH